MQAITGSQMFWPANMYMTGVVLLEIVHHINEVPNYLFKLLVL